MGELAKEIHPVNIEDELKQSYLDYAMSVIIGRALPDVRDGLKPVHRRVLFAMNELGNDWNKPYKKSARIVGDVIGKYHPHGDTAVYDTIVRMAQPFSMREILVDGQGNFGSIDGDSAAAMRYTEIRMSRYAHALLKDLEKETVDFAPNYDETEFAPVVLPTRVPNLLVNGSSGIAVGMATNIPPHNIGEVIDACIALIENPATTIDELMNFVHGPDFPTAGTINGRAGIIDAYRTGRGRIYVRAVANVERDEKNNKQSIIVTELPYQVNKARLIEKIAELVKDKKIEGITALRDESDKDGMRIVVEVRRSDNADVLLNNLYSQTQMETVFGINMVALDGGQPRTLNLKQILEAFINHRRVVVNRRTVFDLRKARERAHILEGLAVALANIDEVIALIKGSPTPADAKDRLLEKSWKPGAVTGMLERAGGHLESQTLSRPDGLADFYGLVNGSYRLSPNQAQAILDLRLHRLTGLEQEKITAEFEALLVSIKDLLDILLNPKRLMQVIKDELIEAKVEFSNPRKTQIISARSDLSREDMITEEDMVVTLSHTGYVKTVPLTTYSAQRRGGRGKAAASVKDEDFVEKLLIANTHDTILCFSSFGKVYWLKVFELPLGSRTAKGRPMVNLLPLEEGERISAMLPIRSMDEGKFVFLGTAFGTVKKVELSQFARPRASGLRALEIVEGDELVGAVATNGQNAIMMFTDAGKVIRFPEDEVRPMGRTARGVRGIRLQENQKVISIIVVNPEGAILTSTENGYGKRTAVSEYPVRSRGGQGVISIQTTDRNGKVVGAVQVLDNDEVMLITDGGTLIRTPVKDISIVGRNTQGVTLINLTNEEKLISIQRIEEIEVPEGSQNLDESTDESIDETTDEGADE